MEFERRRLGVLAPGRETLCYSPHRLFLILCVRGVKIECEQHVAESLADEMAANRHGGLATAGEQRWRPLRRAGRAQRISGLVCDGEVLPWAFVLAVDPWLFRRPSGVTAVIGPWSEVEPPICSAAQTHQEGGAFPCVIRHLYPPPFPQGGVQHSCRCICVTKSLIILERRIDGFLTGRSEVLADFRCE